MRRNTVRTSSSPTPSGHFPFVPHRLRTAIGGGVSLRARVREGGGGGMRGAEIYMIFLVRVLLWGSLGRYVADLEASLV